MTEDPRIGRLLYLLGQAESLCAALVEQSPQVVNLPPGGCSLVDIERAAIIEALRRTNWVQRDAARLLHVTARTICYRIKILRIKRPADIGKSWWKCRDEEQGEGQGVARGYPQSLSGRHQAVRPH